jgi:zinc protease
VNAALDEELAKVSSTPIDAKELTKAKNQLAARAVFQRERVNEIASQIGSGTVVAHDPRHAFSAPEKYDAVSADDVLRVAKKYLTRENSSHVTLEPTVKK